MTPIVLSLPGDAAFAARLAAALNAEMGRCEVRTFPDAETYVRIDTTLEGREVIVTCTLHRPDEKILPLLLLAATAHDLGAARVGLVAPYLAYLRQDARFRAGEGITSRYFARVLSAAFDWLVTIDPHLHRYRSLDEIYTIPAVSVSASSAIGTWIAANVTAPVLLGPDAESAQWVEAVARECGAAWTVFDKVRHGDRDVELDVPDLSKFRAHTPVLLDDMISTGGTLVAAIDHLRRAHLARPLCVAVHAVFAGSAPADLQAAGAARVITCNTIPHPSNAIDIVPVAAAAARRFLSPHP